MLVFVNCSCTHLIILVWIVVACKLSYKSPVWIHNLLALAVEKSQYPSCSCKPPMRWRLKLTVDILRESMKSLMCRGHMTPTHGSLVASKSIQVCMKAYSVCEDTCPRCQQLWNDFPPSLHLWKERWDESVHAASTISPLQWQFACNYVGKCRGCFAAKHPLISFGCFVVIQILLYYLYIYRNMYSI